MHADTQKPRPIPRHGTLWRLVRRHPGGAAGAATLTLVLILCLATLPWTMGGAGGKAGSAPRYNAGSAELGRIGPWWRPADQREAVRLNGLVDEKTVREIAQRHGLIPSRLVDLVDGPPARELREHWPSRRRPLFFLLGTDALGRSVLYRCLAGGGVSLGVGLAAAAIAVLIGTLYGAAAGYAGGWIDGVMMRIVDVLYGLPYILLVVLLAVASDALLDEYVSRAGARHRWILAQVVEQAPAVDSRDQARAYLDEHPAVRQDLEQQASQHLPPRQVSARARSAYNVVILLIAIGGVSWLTMARVVRGQVLSLKARPFIDAARATGAGTGRIFFRHLLPNLVGPIIVYATLTVPQAILQESFLSFLGIGVMPPMPSWGNLAAEGLPELNPYRSHWWTLLFPCLLLAMTLLSLNFIGEALRELMDPRRRGLP